MSSKAFRNLLLSLMLLTLFSCKKGKEDPFISFHSRKARVAGEWNISTYTKEQSTIYAYPNGKTANLLFNQDFGLVNYTETTSDTNNSSRVLNGKISQSHFHFDKSGNWSSVIEYYLYSPQAVGGFYVSKFRVEEDGKWEFQGKKDGLKNKESLLLKKENSNQFFYTYSTYLGTVVDSVADSTLTNYGNSPLPEVWKLIGLSNTRLKAQISAESSFTSAVAGIAGTKVTTSDEISIELQQ